MLLSLSLVSSHLLFFLGFYGLILRRNNLVITLMCLELSLLGISLLFISFGLFLDDVQGQLIFLLLLILAGVESALGLALVIVYYRVRSSVSWSKIYAIKG